MTTVHLCYWLIGANNRKQNIGVACDVHDSATSELVRATMGFTTRFRDARKASNAARRHVRAYARKLAREGLTVTNITYDRDSTLDVQDC